jgi:mRNA interferase RelE/StbE
MLDIEFTTGAIRQWLKLSADVRGRIDARLKRYARTGDGDVTRLKGRQGSRLRVGDWRVIFYTEGSTMVVVAVGHRREIYD